MPKITLVHPKYLFGILLLIKLEKTTILRQPPCSQMEYKSNRAVHIQKTCGNNIKRIANVKHKMKKLPLNPDLFYARTRYLPTTSTSTTSTQTTNEVGESTALTTGSSTVTVCTESNINVANIEATTNESINPGFDFEEAAEFYALPLSPSVSEHSFPFAMVSDGNIDIESPVESTHEV